MDGHVNQGMSPEKKKYAIAAAAAVGFSAWGLHYWYFTKYHEDTDDAQIEAHVIPISPKVAGQVLKVFVDDNQEVDAGDPLVQIDPTDYQVKLDQSKADLAADRARLRRADLDASRVKRLFERGQVSEQDLDHATAEAAIDNARAKLSEEKVAEAELELSYTRIAATEKGRVTRKAVEERAYVQVGQPLLALVTPERWVVANMKETQLTYIHPGQKVLIYADTYPHHAFHGHVDSIQRGTGARFSLLPPENASGNFVKIVQRVPVKIVFDEPIEGYLLGPGMSVEPVIDLK